MEKVEKIEGSITGLTVQFSCVDDLIDRIDELFVKEGPTYKLKMTDGVNGDFLTPKWVREFYPDPNEAATDFLLLLRETEAKHRYISEVRESEKWNDDYEPTQSETFQVQLEKIVNGDIVEFHGGEFSDQVAELLRKEGFRFPCWISSDDFIKKPC